METTKEMAARLRQADRDSLERFMQWGFTEAEKAEHRADDAEYEAARRRELDAATIHDEVSLVDERIFERMRREDRAR